MAYSNLVDAVGGYARRLGTGGRTTLTGLPRTSGSKWRAIMDDFKNRARERSLREQGMRGGIQGSPSQFAQQVAPRAQRPAGDPAQTAITPRDQEGPSRWAQAWPQVQAMGIGMLHGAQTTPYNRAPNWATSLAGGFPAAAAAGANVREQVALSEQEGEQDTFRADMARLMESGELGEEELKRMIAMAIKAEDQQLATALMRMLESVQDADAEAALPTEIETITQDIIDPKTGNTHTKLVNKLTGDVIRDLGISEMAEVLETEAPNWNYSPDGLKRQHPDTGVIYRSPDGGQTWQADPGGRMEAVEAEEVPGDWKTMTPSEPDRKASFSQSSANLAFSRIEPIVGSGDWKPEWGSQFGGLAGRLAQSAEQEMILAQYNQIMAAHLSVRSGATVTEQDERVWKNSFMPQYADDPKTVAYKLEALAAEMGSFNRAARIANKQDILPRWEIGGGTGNPVTEAYEEYWRTREDPDASSSGNAAELFGKIIG